MDTSNVIGQRYTGPYISDGKIQTSVAFGKSEPIDRLDSYSRLHDSAYARWDDLKHRAAADIIYYRDVGKLPGAAPFFASSLVLYGNAVSRAMGSYTWDTAKLYSDLAPVVAEVDAYYATDPYRYRTGQMEPDVGDYFSLRAQRNARHSVPIAPSLALPSKGTSAGECTLGNCPPEPRWENIYARQSQAQNAIPQTGGVYNPYQWWGKWPIRRKRRRRRQ